MSMLLKSLDSVLSQQVFITGQIRDALSGRKPLTRPEIQLVYQSDPDRTFPLEFRQTEDGLFAFFGNPLTAFPDMEGGGALDLRLLVTAERYQTASLDFSLPAEDLAITFPTRTIAGQIVEVPFIEDLPITHAINLSPKPVHLAGRVVDADDPLTPLALASISVIAPEARGPAITDANGFFTLQSMPVANQITVRVSSTGFDTLEETITLDYRRPVNQQTFALSS